MQHRWTMCIGYYFNLSNAQQTDLRYRLRWRNVYRSALIRRLACRRSDEIRLVHRGWSDFVAVANGPQLPSRRSSSNIVVWSDRYTRVIRHLACPRPPEKVLKNGRGSRQLMWSVVADKWLQNDEQTNRRTSAQTFDKQLSTAAANGVVEEVSPGRRTRRGARANRTTTRGGGGNR